jgi:hypothetical protein
MTDLDVPEALTKKAWDLFTASAILDYKYQLSTSRLLYDQPRTKKPKCLLLAVVITAPSYSLLMNGFCQRLSQQCRRRLICRLLSGPL